MQSATKLTKRLLDRCAFPLDLSPFPRFVLSVLADTRNSFDCYDLCYALARRRGETIDFNAAASNVLQLGGAQSEFLELA